MVEEEGKFEELDRELGITTQNPSSKTMDKRSDENMKEKDPEAQKVVRIIKPSTTVPQARGVMEASNVTTNGFEQYFHQ